METRLLRCSGSEEGFKGQGVHVQRGPKRARNEEKDKAAVRPQRKYGQTKKTYNGTLQGRGLTRKSGISTVDCDPVWAYRPRTRICNHPADKLNV